MNNNTLSCPECGGTLLENGESKWCTNIICNYGVVNYLLQKYRLLVDIPYYAKGTLFYCFSSVKYPDDSIFVPCFRIDSITRRIESKKELYELIDKLEENESHVIRLQWMVHYYKDFFLPIE